jgi:hypothetical protein
MFRHQRRGLVTAIGLAVLASIALLAALLQAQPQSSPVMVAKLNNFSGVSDKGSFDDALEAAIENASASAPTGRATVWKVTRISGQSGGSQSPKRVIVTVEAHW